MAEGIHEKGLKAAAIVAACSDVIVHVYSRTVPTPSEVVTVSLLTGVVFYMGVLVGRIDEILATVLAQKQLWGVRGKGERADHYSQAERLVSQPCNRIFLMQSSSTLILGPVGEKETKFFDTLMGKLQQKDIGFYPVVSMAGIEAHLAEQRFDGIGKAFGHLRRDDDGNVLIVDEHEQNGFQLRRSDSPKQDFKQARVLLVGQENAETAQGTIVLDVRQTKSSFELHGPEMNVFLHECIESYPLFPKLTVQDLSQVSELQQHVKGLHKLGPKTEVQGI